jgi:hypothetical protein
MLGSGGFIVYNDTTCIVKCGISQDFTMLWTMFIYMSRRTGLKVRKEYCGEFKENGQGRERRY